MIFTLLTWQKLIYDEIHQIYIVDKNEGSKILTYTPFE